MKALHQQIIIELVVFQIVPEKLILIFTQWIFLKNEKELIQKFRKNRV